jgi:hypothetical protein
VDDVVDEIETAPEDAAPPTPRLRALVTAFAVGGLIVLAISLRGLVIGPTDGRTGPVRACVRAVTDELHRSVGLDDVDSRRLDDTWIIRGTADGQAWRCEVDARQTVSGWQVLEVSPL